MLRKIFGPRIKKSRAAGKHCRVRKFMICVLYQGGLNG
jgi:hypothetical protein